MKRIWQGLCWNQTELGPTPKSILATDLRLYKAQSDYYTKSVTPKQFPQIYGVTKKPMTQAQIFNSPTQH